MVYIHLFNHQLLLLLQLQPKLRELFPQGPISGGPISDSMGTAPVLSRREPGRAPGTARQAQRRASTSRPAGKKRDVRCPMFDLIFDSPCCLLVSVQGVPDYTGHFNSVGLLSGLAYRKPTGQLLLSGSMLSYRGLPIGHIGKLRKIQVNMWR